MPGRPGCPSVTEILDPWADFSMIRPDVLEHAAGRGSRVHAFIAADLKGEWMPGIDADCQGYFDSYRRWADKMVDAVIYVERELVHSVLGYQGHLDLFARIKNKQMAVIDWKTPVAESKPWGPQIAGGYWALLVDYKFVVNPGGACAVMLSPKGKMAKLIDYTPVQAQCEAVFLSALNVHNWMKGGKE